MMTVKVTDDDGKETDVTVKPRDVVVWEELGSGRNFGEFREGLTLGSIYELAHIACRRTGVDVGSLAEFKARYDVLPVRDSGPDPTLPAA